MLTDHTATCRYAIDTQGVDWAAAEGQVKGGQKGGQGIVSVKKSGQAVKRKADELHSNDEPGEKKKNRRGKKQKS